MGAGAAATFPTAALTGALAGTVVFALTAGAGATFPLAGVGAAAGLPNENRLFLTGATTGAGTGAGITFLP